MKRYRMSGSFGPDAYATKMWSLEEHSDGEWVGWEDVKEAVTAHADWIERGLWPKAEPGPVQECNCEEMVNNPEPTYFKIFDGTHAWICPAHGYKKR